MKVVICCFLWCLVYASQCMAKVVNVSKTLASPLYLKCDRVCFSNSGLHVKMHSADTPSNISIPTGDLPANPMMLLTHAMLYYSSSMRSANDQIDAFSQQINPNANEQQIQLYPISTKANIGNKPVTIKLRVSGFVNSIGSYYFGHCANGYTQPSTVIFHGYRSHISSQIWSFGSILYEKKLQYPIAGDHFIEVRSKGGPVSLSKPGNQYYRSPCYKSSPAVYNGYSIERLYLSSDVISHGLNAFVVNDTEWRNKNQIIFKIQVMNVSQVVSGGSHQYRSVNDSYYMNFLIPVAGIHLNFTNIFSFIVSFGQQGYPPSPAVMSKSVTLTKDATFSHDMSATVPFYLITNRDAPMTVTMHCDKNAKGQCVLKNGNTNAPYNIYMKMRPSCFDPNRALVSDQPMTINNVKYHQLKSGSFVLKAKNIINAKNAGKRLTGTVTFTFSILP